MNPRREPHQPSRVFVVSPGGFTLYYLPATCEVISVLTPEPRSESNSVDTCSHSEHD